MFGRPTAFVSIRDFERAKSTHSTLLAIGPFLFVDFFYSRVALCPVASNGKKNLVKKIPHT